MTDEKTVKPEGPSGPIAADRTTDLDLYQVAAFTGPDCDGGPAAVVVLRRWPDRLIVQSIARELGLAETAFVVPTDGIWPLRLALFSMIVTAGTPLDLWLQDARLELFFPADEVRASWFDGARGSP